MPGLCIARSLGDLNAARAGVVCTPDVQRHALDADARFLILASDGVWEFLSIERAVNLVDTFYREKKRAIDACRRLIAEAALEWYHHEGVYRDDITAVIVYLPQARASLATADEAAKATGSV